MLFESNIDIMKPAPAKIPASCGMNLCAALPACFPSQTEHHAFAEAKALRQPYTVLSPKQGRFCKKSFMLSPKQPHLRKKLAMLSPKQTCPGKKMPCFRQSKTGFTWKCSCYCQSAGADKVKRIIRSQ